MKCPRCNSENIGKIGRKLYYCRDCACEIKIEKWGVQIFEFDMDGSLCKTYKVCFNNV